MTSSTVSRESAPRSSTKEASGVTSLASTPSCSTMMLLTFSSTLIPVLHFAQFAGGLFFLKQDPGARGLKSLNVKRQTSNGARISSSFHVSRFTFYVSHVQPSRDVEHVSRHIGRLLGSEVGDGRGDVFGCPESRQRNLSRERLLGLGGHFFRHGRRDETRRDSVTSD